MNRGLPSWAVLAVALPNFGSGLGLVYLSSAALPRSRSCSRSRLSALARTFRSKDGWLLYECKRRLIFKLGILSDELL